MRCKRVGEVLSLRPRATHRISNQQRPRAQIALSRFKSESLSLAVDWALPLYRLPRMPDVRYRWSMRSLSGCVCEWSSNAADPSTLRAPAEPARSNIQTVRSAERPDSRFIYESCRHVSGPGEEKNCISCPAITRNSLNPRRNEQNGSDLWTNLVQGE